MTEKTLHMKFQFAGTNMLWPITFTGLHLDQNTAVSLILINMFSLLRFFSNAIYVKNV